MVNGIRDPQKSARNYVSIVSILLAVLLIAIPLTYFGLKYSSGGDTGVVLLLPLVLLGFIVGILGIVNLVAIPIILSRRLLAGKYIVLATVSVVIGAAVAGFGIWQVSSLIKIQNHYEQSVKDRNAEMPGMNR